MTMSGAILIALMFATGASEVYTGGDDGLTQRLADAVRARLEVSPPRIPLTVLIPTHVGWSESGGRVRVSYRVEYSRSGALIAKGQGSCWEDQLDRCADEIVRRAKGL